MKEPSTYFSTTGSDSIIGPNVTVDGPLEVNGDLTIEGETKGDISAGGAVVVGINATLFSDVEADTVSVSGKIVGNIYSDGKTTIREMGAITGDVESAGLTILPGGIFSGRSLIHGRKAEIMVAEKPVKPKKTRP